MNTVFTETQKFNKWWHYLLSALPLFIAVTTYLGICMDFIPLRGSDNQPVVIVPLIFTMLFAVLFFLWFFLLTLKTVINKDGIVAKFALLPFCKRTIRWEEIQSISLVTYSPLYDYGGWGVRYGLSGKGWCYNVSGTDGIKIVYKNGKTFLIGTQRREEAEKIIHSHHKH